MSGKKPLHEKPLSEGAVKGALNKIFGNRTPDEERYLAYQHYIAKRQPGYWSQIQRLADYCEKSARLIDYPAELQTHTVIGGGLIYMASAEEQAVIERRYVPPINYLKAEKAFGALAITHIEAQEDVEDFASAFGELLTNDEKATLLDTGLAGQFDVLHSMPEERQAAFDPESDLAEKAKRAAGSILRSLFRGTVVFLQREPGFVEVMNDWWWNDLDPQLSAGQLLGATITRQMIWPPR